LYGKSKKEEETDTTISTSRDADFSALVDMGFSLEVPQPHFVKYRLLQMAKGALSMTTSLEEATNLLLTDPEMVKQAKPSNQPSPAKPKSPTGASRVDELFESPDKVREHEYFAALTAGRR